MTKEVTGAEALAVVVEAVVRQAQEPASSVDKKVRPHFPASHLVPAW